MANHLGKLMRASFCAAVFLGAMVVLLSAGCAKHTEPIVPADEMHPGEPEFLAMWDATKEVLRDYRFELDRQDRRAGVITTEPLLGRHGMEFWRKDAATREAVCEGTLQTIYRTATVEIVPEDGEYRPVVRVNVSRSDRRTPQVTSTSEAIALFRLPGDSSDRQRYLMEYELGDEETEEVGISRLGRDEALERELTEEIISTARSIQ
ncbi:MAG: hypothetical protein ACP5HU_07355 [Phycisphaerae bacterium]